MSLWVIAAFLGQTINLGREKVSKREEELGGGNLGYKNTNKGGEVVYK
jgi:hypothetical protein